MKPAFSIFAHIYIVTMQIKDWISVWIDPGLRCSAVPKTNVSRVGGILMVFLLLTTSAYSFGFTSVVVIWKPGEVVVAADSRDCSSALVPKPQIDCKILRVGEFAWTSAFLYEDPVSGFSLPSLVAKSAQRKKTLSEMVTSFDSGICKILENELRGFKSRHDTDAKLMMDLLRKGNPILQIAFIGTDNGQPAYFFREFVPKDLDSDKVSIAMTLAQHCPDHCNPAMAALLGYRAEINELVRKRGDWQNAFGDTTKLAKFMVEVEIFAHGDCVGLPINILRLSGDGFHWIEQPSCKTKHTKPTSSSGR